MRGSLEELTFQPTGSGYRAQVSRERYAGRGMLELDIPPAPGAQAYTQTYEGKTYFYAELPVPVRTTARVLPRIVGLVWDSSGSGALRDHVREFALLDAYFRRMRDGEVRLTRIRDAAGRLAGEAIGGSSNIYQDFDGALGMIVATAAEAAAKAGLSTRDVHAGLGLAGLITSVGAERIASANLPFASVTSDNDAYAACVGAFGGGNGGIVIAGNRKALAIAAGLDAITADPRFE